MSTRDWQTPSGLSSLSAALDEIYFLRAVLADEASIIEAHLSLKTFPKTRRPYAELQVKRMRRMAGGEMWQAARRDFDQTRALRQAGVSASLTEVQWATTRGLVPVDREASE